ncbi:MAG: adenylate/guanylate cyclase domain-containing protein, partial [Gammaproteobacteria bacterium]|nr:adenylate/guanylate cyclase domain-containing protein [Gammaproteobacteria bacterium]
MTTETYRCVVMFADVAGSTRLYEELGDQLAQQVIAERLASMAAVVERFQGTVIKTIGDEIMVRFDEPDLAIMAACHIHELGASKTVQGVILSEHIGLHYGSTVRSKGDLFGDAVNVAARLTSVARGGQIMTSQETMDRLSDDLSLLARRFDVTKVKGRSQPVTMYEVIWESEDDVTGIHDQGVTRPLALEPLLLRCHTEERTLLPNSVMLLGRGSQCDLVIKGNAISRLHAFIEYHNGKFILRDESTNGTYVKMNGGRT